MIRRYGFWLILPAVLLGVIFLTWKITSVQFRINMAAPVQRTPGGGVTSIRYGSTSPVLWNASRGGGSYVRSHAPSFSGGGVYASGAA